MASTSATALRAAKRQLRKSMAQTLATMKPDEIAKQSQRVAEQVLKSQTYARARSISVYIHMDVGEVITDEICRSVLKDGKKLYVPLFASPSAPAVATGPTVPAAPTPVKTEFATDMIMLRLRDVAEYESMEANAWGIREPPLTYADGTIREEGKFFIAIHRFIPEIKLTYLSTIVLYIHSSRRDDRWRWSRSHPCAWSGLRSRRRQIGPRQRVLRPILDTSRRVGSTKRHARSCDGRIGVA